jgi:heat-inducible transcriptional repressor
MYDLSPRQIDILKNIVKEYIDTAEAVGSETLEKKYDLGVSPATIRNEMAEMVKLGYLSKPHSSAGRIPSSKAIKFYINELMKEKEMSVAEEVEAKEKIWDLREGREKFLREATHSLAQKTRSLAVAATEEMFIIQAIQTFLKCLNFTI